MKATTSDAVRCHACWVIRKTCLKQWHPHWRRIKTAFVASRPESTTAYNVEITFHCIRRYSLSTTRSLEVTKYVAHALTHSLAFIDNRKRQRDGCSSWLLRNVCLVVRTANSLDTFNESVSGVRRDPLILPAHDVKMVVNTRY